MHTFARSSRCVSDSGEDIVGALRFEREVDGLGALDTVAVSDSCG